jgi:hypothetical protein
MPLRNYGRMTRNSYRQWVNNGMPESQQTEPEEEPCEECEEALSVANSWSQHSMENQDIPNLPRSQYRPNDRCNRHRLPDDTPYTEEVRSYRRRK